MATKDEIHGVEINWTHFWKQDEKAEMRPLLKEVFTEYVEFVGEEITIGRTKSARGQRPRKKGMEKRRDRYYIRLNPDSADKFTIAHELNHILTREKNIDLMTIKRNPEFLRETGYLDVPEEVINNMDNWTVAAAVSQCAKVCLERHSKDAPPPAKRFEKDMEEIAEEIRNGEVAGL